MPDASKFQFYGGETVNLKDAQARQNISKLQADVDELERNINADISSINNKLGTAQSDITELEKRITPVDDFSNTIFVGDSFGQGWSPDGTYSSWEEQLASILPGLEQSAEINGGGIGFSHVSVSIKQNALQCWNANKRSINWLATATAVIVMLGINDTDQNAPSVKSNAENFFEQVKSDCPNATIYYFFNTGYTIASRGICMACYEAAYSHSYIRCYESAWWMLLQDSYFASDFKHPNAAGHQLIARKMLNALMGVEVNNHVYKNIDDVANSKFNVYVTNQEIRIYASREVTANRADVMGHFPAEFFDGNGSPAITCTDIVGLQGSNTTIVGSCAVCFGGSAFGRSVFAIHAGTDLTTGVIRFCKTFNVYSFFGE